MPVFRILRAALEADGRAWAAALGDPAWRRRARTLKVDGDTSVLRARLLERDVVIKSWKLGPKARLQSLLGLSRALRHWRGAARLRKAGIPTAWTWALLRGREDGRVVEHLVMEALPGKSLLHHIAERDLTVRQEHALAAAAGNLIATLSAAGLFNRDHKPSNLIVTDPGPGAPAIAVIDCLAIRARPDPDRMLASLVIESIGAGCRPRCALMMRVVKNANRHPPCAQGAAERNRVREAWRTVSRLVRDHGDPTPRVNPLA